MNGPASQKDLSSLPFPNLALSLLLAFTSCTPTKVQTSGELLNYPIGSINKFTLSQNRPSQAAPWSAEFIRVAQKSRTQTSRWKIGAISTGVTLVDRIADEAVLEHFFELLSQLQITKEVELSENEKIRRRTLLERAGLLPPKASVDLGLGGDTGRSIQIGSPDPVDSCTWISIAPSHTTPPLRLTCVSGNALSMLKLFENFGILRKRTFSLTLPDAIDEMEINPQTPEHLYAQRDGSDWADREHTVLKAIPIPGEPSRVPEVFLNQLMTTPIKRFLDSSGENERLLATLKTSPLIDAKLIDRYGKVTQVRIKKLPSGIFAWNSTRPEAVFELEPKNWNLIP